MQGPCCCQSGKGQPSPTDKAAPLRELTPLRPQPVDRLRYFGTGALVLAVWTGCYLVIEPLARLLTQAVPGLSERAAAALEFFLYDTAKILLLLLLMVYVIGWLRAGLHVERVRDFLAGRRRVLGYVLGAGFGAITPFCSCSSIPLFLGFTTSGIPVGITLAFLITSPLINEIAVVLLWGLLGWKLTLVYVLAGLGAGIVGGWLMDVLRAERWLQDYLKEKYTTKEELLDVLAKVGGLDLAALAGFYIGCAARGIPVVLDGLITGAAALAAVRLCPAAGEYLLASHVSAEPAGKLVLEALGLRAAIDAGMCLGEGCGAAVLFPLLDMAAEVYGKMETFDQMQVEQYERFETEDGEGKSR